MDLHIDTNGKKEGLINICLSTDYQSAEALEVEVWNAVKTNSGWYSWFSLIHPLISNKLGPICIIGPSDVTLKVLNKLQQYEL